MTRATPIPINLDQLEARILGRERGMHWYTLIIEPRSWERVAERAGEMGYATYCPMLRERVTDGRRAGQITERPALGGYMFVDMPGPARRFDLFKPATEAVEPILGCRGFIAIDGSPVALHEAVIDGIRHREGLGTFDKTKPKTGWRKWLKATSWAKRGATIEFVGEDCPFAGFFGKIAGIEDGLADIEFEIMGRATTISSPLDWIRRARREVDRVDFAKKMCNSRSPQSSTASGQNRAARSAA
jgi:transcription antitermination factor NusG